MSFGCPNVSTAEPPTTAGGTPPPTTVVDRAASPPADRSAAIALRSVLEALGPLRRNFVNDTAENAETRLRVDANYAALAEETRAGKWRAALVSDSAEDRWAINQRFDSLAAMKRFLREHEAVVEVWLFGGSESDDRRLTAREVSDWSNRESRSPTYLTTTYRDSKNGEVIRHRLEFGFGAAAETLASAHAYRRHRDFLSQLRLVLGSRGADGNLSAEAQWEALGRARRSGSLTIGTMPSPPENELDLMHAFECRTTLDGQITEVLRVFKASEIKPRLIDGLTVIEINPQGSTQTLTAVLYNPTLNQPIGKERQPVAQGTELRIRDAAVTDPRRWTRLEFGQPSLLRRQGLANFGLVNAHMESARKGLALRKSKIDRVAEPIFAGLNVGGGIAGAGAPLGESARLGYNLLLGRRFTPHVPSADELRDLYAVYLAKSRHPELNGKVPAKLERSEMRTLESIAKQIPNQEVEDALRSIDERDLAAMLQLPKRQNADKKFRLFADILTDLAKVTGESESGILRDIFDNQKVTPSGDVSLSTLLALAFGQETLTPLSGVSLEDLANGEGPTRAWLQYFNVSLDLRAIANTSYLLRKKGEVDRELQKPFAHAPRMSDLASYEIRIFGYPLLLRYKLGLLEDDIEAFENSYAYGILGTRVVTRFETQNDFNRALRSGNMAPIGLVKISKRRGLLRRERIESNLPVFGYRIPGGDHVGETAIIIYGMSAHRSYSEFMERETLRYAEFEKILESGGVIHRLIAAEDPDSLPRTAFEPEIAVGTTPVTEKFANLLSDLTEFDRHVKFAKWDLARTPEEELAARKLSAALRARGIDADPASSPLIEVDDHFGTFVYRRRVEGKWQFIETVLFPSRHGIRQDLEKKTTEAQAEREKRKAANTAEQEQQHP